MDSAEMPAAIMRCKICNKPRVYKYFEVWKYIGMLYWVAFIGKPLYTCDRCRVTRS